MIRIGNCSGFYGDRRSAMREMLTEGELDVLTGDYLAEMTMLILGRDRANDPTLGYAKTFLRQLEECLGLAIDTGVRIVVNAGGLNPAGLGHRVHEIAQRLGIGVRVAHVTGDDLSSRAEELGFPGYLTANAYLGAWGIAECLTAGADIVVTGRTTDAALAVGPAAAHFGWQRTDYDRLAGAVAAGHVIECGAQATGGNYAFFTELTDLAHPGFPIAEMHRDGSSVITKHPDTGGAVTVDTVTAQLVYEIDDARYAGPDVTTRLDSITLTEAGPDRVRISGAQGEPPPPDHKVCLTTVGGHRNELTFVLTGLDIEAKADLVRTQFEAELPRRPSELTWTLVRLDQADAATQEQASALLRCVGRDPDPDAVGRSFSSTAVALALASYPGFTLTAPPTNGSVYGAFAPATVNSREVTHRAVLPEGTAVDIEPSPRTQPLAEVAEPELPAAPPAGPTRAVPLGTIAAARSGDKGGDANIGVWVRTEPQWRWLVHELSPQRLRELLPETAELEISRTLLPRLRAVNFVVHGLLGAGVAAQARFDPQAKGLGEWLRSRHVAIPEEILS
ncbi:acyclic terpene utilization AtuA family protein [Lipingzhangella sp. LS1_29]|uniref:Acyclic terpene utilization AtuA family protein n=1 Tax=Lipingzhangella rawalii TaxID=2055835 RepID=A0ABU2H6P3_9ACTN|nr:acyclic terpene utilization AtuA family protein [Lipingzhangella rawalii]MDS1270519.1 acyclic terpene utilization AtuA family protein [Lipingzhangella rawalii]